MWVTYVSSSKVSNHYLRLPRPWTKKKRFFPPTTLQHFPNLSCYRQLAFTRRICFAFTIPRLLPPTLILLLHSSSSTSICGLDQSDLFCPVPPSSLLARPTPSALPSDRPSANLRSGHKNAAICLLISSALTANRAGPRADHQLFLGARPARTALCLLPNVLRGFKLSGNDFYTALCLLQVL